MKKRSSLFKFSIIALILFAVWIFLASFLANNLIVEKPLENADVIMVLSGSREFIERTHKAAELYNQGVSQKIILTDDGGRAGWSREERTNLKYSELAKRELIKQGVAAENIEILEPQVGGTIYEARLFFSNYVKNYTVKNVLLVTSAYHTNRTIWTFEREMRRNNSSVYFGIEYAPLDDSNPPPQTWWMSISGWRVVAGEYLKTVVYWIFY